MRLIDVRECSLNEPYEIVLIDKAEVEREQEAKLRYAILSHRWQRGEVTLKDLSTSTWQSKYGTAKLVDSVKLARADGHQYLWLDTCCIDKDSSADLSEAINSMYRWYAEADICYAYLADVDVVEAYEDHSRSLGESVWFKRGWTLQELLAPTDMALYSSQWSRLGQRKDLADKLSAITGIPESILRGQEQASEWSIAERMSWASGRQTERVEDLAYSLMGLFSVNMPLLYGEGEEAFQRLQEEILRRSDDYSIFAWRKSSREARRQPVHGLLADRPADFGQSMGVKRQDFWREIMPVAMTSRGLYIELAVDEGRRDTHVMWACLPCAGHDQSARFLGIRISALTGLGRQYARVHTDVLEPVSAEGALRRMYFPQTLAVRGVTRSNVYHLSLRYTDHPDGSKTVLLAVLLNQHPFNHGGSHQPGKNTLDARLLNDSIVGPIHIPCWNPGIEAIMLFRGRDARVGTFFFVILLGTLLEGGLGYALSRKESSAVFDVKAESAEFRLNGKLIESDDREAQAFAVWPGCSTMRSRSFQLSPPGSASQLHPIYGDCGVQFTLTVNMLGIKANADEVALVMSSEIAVNNSAEARDVGSSTTTSRVGQWLLGKK